MGAGGIVEAAMCYTGDVSDPKKGRYDLDYYLDFVRQLHALGIHVLAIKDMAGLLKPEATRHQTRGRRRTRQGWRRQRSIRTQRKSAIGEYRRSERRFVQGGTTQGVEWGAGKHRRSDARGGVGYEGE